MKRSKFSEQQIAFLLRQVEGITPYSAVKDMIGSQSTKAMHVVARFALQRVSLGVWSDNDCLTVIETYPALCRARLGVQLQEIASTRTYREADINDAGICARIAYDFHLKRGTLELPPADAPASEGWIWAPRSVISKEPVQS